MTDYVPERATPREVMKQCNVKVTQKHIDHSSVQDAFQNPLRLAVHEMLVPNVQSTTFLNAWIAMWEQTGNKLVIKCLIPDDAREHLVRFQAGEKIEPFEIEMQLPERLLRSVEIKIDPVFVPTEPAKKSRKRKKPLK